MLPFFVQIRRLVQPLGNLSKAAQQFADGNLDYPTPPLVHGDDEISQLTTSFQGMAEALVRNRDTQAANLAALNNEKSTLDALARHHAGGRDFCRSQSHPLSAMPRFTACSCWARTNNWSDMRNDALLLRIGQIVAEADTFLKTIAEILDTRKLTEPKYFTLKDGRIVRLISNIVIAPEATVTLDVSGYSMTSTEEKKTVADGRAARLNRIR